MSVSSTFGLIASGVMAIVASPSLAQQAPARIDPAAPPVVEVRVYSSDGRIARRSFDLINGTATSLCVASTTGRYRLRVVSMSGGAMRGADAGSTIAYRVKFRDGSGAEQVKTMQGSEIAFEGRSPGTTDCSHGANAFMLVDSPEQALTVPVAGSYADRLSLSAEPL